MSLSKKNNDKLNSYLKNNVHKANKIQSTISDEIFYSIIDNEIDIRERDTMKDILKKNEINSIKIDPKAHFTDNINHNQLSEEDLLYDEFNYLLDE